MCVIITALLLHYAQLSRRSRAPSKTLQSFAVEADNGSNGRATDVNGNMPSLCAIGDMHGDPKHAVRALQLCGAVDADGRWSGGTMTVVQVGDVFDRGNASIPLQYYLWELRDQAAEAGGELKLLLGNHELLNLQSQVFYVHGFSRGGMHSGELAEFGGVQAWRQALDPNRGAIGMKIVQHDALAVRGRGACRTLFLHAGLRLAAAKAYGGVAELNEAVRSQILHNRGERLDARVGPLWWRGYARPSYYPGAGGVGLAAAEAAACDELAAALEAAGDGARRMAVGHNIVPWVSTRCGGLLQMIDQGMSGAYGGRPAAWRCDLDAHTGEADVRALYEGVDEPVPPLCDRCAELQQRKLRMSDAPMHAASDCAEYCG